MNFSYGQNLVLQNVSMYIKPGEIVGLTGPVGAGKSTFMRLLVGLLEPDNGIMKIDGYSHSAKRFREMIGVLFQHSSRQLFEKTVYDDIAFGPSNFGLDKRDIEAQVQNAVDIVGLDESLLEVSPFGISGGEQKLVALAGIIAQLPRYMLLDEPFAGLDTKGKTRLPYIIQALQNMGVGIIVISHHLDKLLEVAPRIIYLRDGRVCFDGQRQQYLLDDTLPLPAITNLMKGLHERGLPVNPDTFTVKSAMKQLAKLGLGDVDDA
ncbi:ATP-binding cassette domain-containing protein [Methanohalophilus mahii]|uniref:ABC transporter related protein n=1 Tax=Methanohalophilus mahii (strain ATCC 35705 / DSM 5219 / SLP) TaxID=547558 RepID=D5E984_METMS|nr:ATP-binding cassette domain-containing protein [Methanohalophilus mahii]ADE35735.1 ABC transporter related protein [Methanohalophilus mahii DSM 5219]